MKIINNLNIHKKITITSVVSILFMIVISVFSYTNLLHEEETIYDLVKVKMHTVEHDSKTTAMIRLVNGNMYKIFNLKSAGFDTKDIKQKQIKELNDLENYLKEVINCPFVGEENKIYYEKMFKNYKIYKRVAVDSLEMMQFNEHVSFMLFLGSDEIYKNIVKLLEKSSAISNNQSLKAYEDSMNGVTTMIIMLFALIGIAIFASTLLSIKVANSIKVPLESLQNGLLEFFKYISHEKESVEPVKVFYSDEIGSMSEIINKNIKKTQKDMEKDSHMISSLITCVESVNNGYLNNKIENEPNQKELKKVKEMFNFMLENLEKKIGQDINHILQTLDDYSKYNYNSTIQNAQGRVEITINELGTTIKKMLNENLNNGKALKEKASTLFDSVDILEENTTKQKELVIESSFELKTLTDELTKQVINSSLIASHSDEVNISAEKGTTFANSTAKAMDNMIRMVDEINKSIEIIDNIVVQTNILSLNASVEAVSAGEAGKGFAVVASEVRNLASQSSNASNEIKKIVNKAKERADEGKKVVQDMIDGYKVLITNIESTMSIINDNITSSNKQETSIHNINDIVSQLFRQSSKTTDIVSKTHSIADETNGIAKKIVKDVEKLNKNLEVSI